MLYYKQLSLEWTKSGSLKLQVRDEVLGDLLLLVLSTPFCTDKDGDDSELHSPSFDF